MIRAENRDMHINKDGPQGETRSPVRERRPLRGGKSREETTGGKFGIFYEKKRSVGKRERPRKKNYFWRKRKLKACALGNVPDAFVKE